MKNLEQMRAANALRFWQNPPSKVRGAEGGEVVAKLPAMILSNGLLATAAFARSKSEMDEETKTVKEKSGHEEIIEELGKFLGGERSDGRRLWQASTGTLDQFVGHLTRSDSAVLQQATAEALAYLGYLKRFAL